MIALNCVLQIALMHLVIFPYPMSHRKSRVCRGSTGVSGLTESGVSGGPAGGFTESIKGLTSDPRLACVCVRLCECVRVRSGVCLWSTATKVLLCFLAVTAWIIESRNTSQRRRQTTSAVKVSRHREVGDGAEECATMERDVRAVQKASSTQMQQWTAGPGTS